MGQSRRAREMNVEEEVVVVVEEEQRVRVNQTGDPLMLSLLPKGNEVHHRNLDNQALCLG